MAWINVLAAYLGLVQSLAGLVGTLLIYFLVDHPNLFRSKVIPRQFKDSGNKVPLMAPTNLSINSSNDEPQQKVYIYTMDILADYSIDADREIIFCFSIVCSLLNIIWAVSSFVLLLNFTAKTYRTLWQWVLVTLAVLIFDLIGACFFAAKTANHVANVSNNTKNLEEPVFNFLRYGYPLILFVVFSRGFVTYPINVFLSFKAYRKAEALYQEEIKVNPPLLPGSSENELNGGVKETRPSNGRDVQAEVYTNQVFTIDEKL